MHTMIAPGTYTSRDVTRPVRSMSVPLSMIEAMTTVPLHRARAGLSWIVSEAARSPVTITRNGRPVAVVVSPSAVQGGQPITSDVRGAIQADLTHALALLCDGN